MPALTRLAPQNGPGAGFSVLGVARRPKSDEAFRAELREALPAELHQDFDALAPRVGYQAADVANPDQLKQLRRRVDALPGGSESGRLFYLALKPELFGPTVEGLCRAGLLGRRAFRLDLIHAQQNVVRVGSLRWQFHD